MRKNETLKVVWLVAVVMIAVIFAVPAIEVSAKSSKKTLAKYKLSVTKKTMEEGQTYTISMKLPAAELRGISPRLAPLVISLLRSRAAGN